MPIRVRARRGVRPAPRPATPPALGLPLPPPGWPQPPAGLSLCMIVKNEERFLEQCLRSVEGIVDEINIVDTGSTDRTLEIARQFGARIEHREWRNDFGWARNEALQMATKRWILQLDADEELLPESRETLEQIKSAPAHLTGLWVRCQNASDKYGKGGTVSHAIVRVFPNTPRIRFQGAIHEFPSVDGAVLSIAAVSSPVKIVHHGYLDDVVNERDKYARNMAIIEQAMAKEPEEAFHWYNLAMTAHLGGDQPRAAEGFERMWALCRKHGMRAFTPNGLQMLADIYSEHLGQPEKGLEIAAECLKLAPNYANGHFSAGKANLLLKRYDAAREMYLKAIDDAKYLDKQFVVDDEVPAWKAQCEIGSSYAEQGDHTAALEWFEKALANRPNVEPVRINRAMALEHLGRIAEAENAFREVYGDAPSEQATLNLVNYLLRHGSEREAVALIERHFRDVRKEFGVSMLMAAAAVTQRAGWGDGKAYLLDALSLDPHSTEAQTALAALESGTPAADVLFERIGERTRSGAHDDALRLASEAARAYPSDERFPYYAALACANLGRKSDALAHLETIPNAVHAGPWFLRAAILREEGRYADALVSVERIIARNPQNVDALLLKAALLGQLERNAEVEPVLLAAMPYGKERAAVELASFYLRSGRAEEARLVAEQALR